MSVLTVTRIQSFQTLITQYYAAHKRDMPWRQPKADGCFDPYAIMVSEIMLQQTQVARVIPKFEEFMTAFSSVQALYSASPGEVLKMWAGLGYNRRAKFLWQAAQHIVRDLGGEFPTTMATLQQLPGVGASTAGAIMVYAYNQPAVFIETNIRTVFIKVFFKNQSNVSDKAIRELLTHALSGQSPREFYWGLMDYGTYLKATVGNLSRSSHHYRKQATFIGSRRQLRGQIVQLLTHHSYTPQQLMEQLPDRRLAPVLLALTSEGLIQRVGEAYKIL